MMRKTSRLLLCLVLVVGMFATAIGCQGKPSGTTFSVEVSGGTGGGTYLENVNCTVVAAVPTGKQFMKWVSDGEDMSSNDTFVFTVKKDIKLEAVFVDYVDAKELCEVNVKFGTGSGSFFTGTQRQLKISASYENLKFLGWEATSKGANGADVVEMISTVTPYNLTITKSMNIVARFESVKLETPINKDGQQFRISGNGAYEFDRAGKTVFTQGVGHLVYNVYASAAADAEVIATFKIVLNSDGKNARLTNMDETKSQELKGGIGDLYHDFEAEKENIRSIIGLAKDSTYHFAVKAMGLTDSPYTDSDLSVIGPGYKF